MSSTKETSAAENEASWKARALELASELESARSEWHNAQQTLTRALLRIAVAFSGFDPELDRELETWRHGLRETGNPSLYCGQMQNIAECCVQLFRRAGKTTSPAEHTTFLALLGALALPPVIATEIRDITRRIESGEDPAALMPHVAHQLNELLAVEEDDKPANDGELPTPLLNLLDHMPLPPEFEPRRQALRTTIVSGGIADPVKEASSLLSDVHLFLRKDARVLEDYLKRASQYLGTIDTQLRFAMDTSRAGATDSDALSADINAGIEQIGAAMQGDFGGDGAFQAQMEARVGAIRASLGDFFDLQRRQRSEYEERIAELTNQVESFEMESVRLRESLAVEHARAYRDALTDIPNRLAYQERGEFEIKRHRRSGRPLCLAVVDLDRFKQVNDRYGHRVGDKLLRSVATIATDRFRSTDMFARYGGEEFVVLLPETSEQDAARLCDDFRLRIAAAAFQSQGEVIPVTISIGLAQFTDGETLDSLFERADAALYRAKARGRNCLIVA